MRTRTWTAAAVLPLVAGALVTAGPAQAAVTGASTSGDKTGNMIFIHPDGTNSATWQAARTYWAGPDASLEWDLLPVTVNYRGHSSDDLTTSSNGGATTHAFGYKVDAPDSFGTDSGAAQVTGGDAAAPRTINSLSGYEGSWLRQAANTGHPMGVVNDGDVAEPGTAAFLTEVTERTDASALLIADQLINGRPGFRSSAISPDATPDADPVVIMGGGEDLFFPTGTPICAKGAIAADCVVHRPAGDTLDADGPSATGGLRTDGVNLVQAAINKGYTVVRTRTEFEAARQAITSGEVDPATVKILALFASQDIFNATSEEQLIADGLVDASVSEQAKETNLVLYGSEPGTPGYRPPTAPEMAEMATTVLQAHSELVGKPFATVWEVEGTDNFSNANNSIGTLTEANYADEMIGVARRFLQQDPATTVLTAADGDAGGLVLNTFNIDEDAPATVEGEGAPVNPGPEAVGVEEEDASTPLSPLDGRYGRDSAPFIAAADQFGQEMTFGVSWAGTGDYTAGVISRADGLAADFVAGRSARFDNVDVYRTAYLTLFGEELAYPEGQVAPTR